MMTETLMTADAAAAVAPPATRIDVPITPNPIPSDPSIIWAIIGKAEIGCHVGSWSTMAWSYHCSSRTNR